MVRQATDELLDRSAYDAPDLECDIVMKGGITSGVVYPLAVCELARRYRLVSVGGSMRVSSPPVGTIPTASDVTDRPNRNSKPRCGSADCRPPGCGGAAPIRSMKIPA
jgi:hypothetical protein